MSTKRNSLIIQDDILKNSIIFSKVMKETQNGQNIPIILKNEVPVHKLTIFEDICIRNKDNLNIPAIEINNYSMTYAEFFIEVEKYIKSFVSIGVKENDIVTLCLPVGVEFICAYFALTTIGAVCNATNIMFIIKDGLAAYTEKRCSTIMMCSTQYAKLMHQSGAFTDSHLEQIILTDGAVYSKISENDIDTNIDELIISLNNVKICNLEDFLNIHKKPNICIAKYNENRPSTFTYTSGTTGTSKCMAHSDLAPLFLIASHDFIQRQDELAGDRTLITIPFQHPTGLFYATVLQLACGKTLVLEPRYDKSIFYSDIKNLKINHAVQAKPFYAQLIEDRKAGRLKKDDFKLFKHPYSGGEGIPKAVCKEINDTLHFAGCPNDITIGYGRSEEGSSTIISYNIPERANTVGKPMPGIKVRLVDPKTKEIIQQEIGSKGEIQVCTPVTPIGNHYLGPYNIKGISDKSFLDELGNRWAQPEDIATIVECGNGERSYLVLGRSDDCIIRNGKTIYLFDLKETISGIEGVQECEVIVIKSDNKEYITVHIVPEKQYSNAIEFLVKNICHSTKYIDGVKIYNSFGINATSGKCDREAMQQCKTDYYIYREGHIKSVDF